MNTEANYEGCKETAACMCKRCVAFDDARVRKEVAAMNAAAKAKKAVECDGNGTPLRDDSMGAGAGW